MLLMLVKSQVFARTCESIIASTWGTNYFCSKILDVSPLVLSPSSCFQAPYSTLLPSLALPSINRFHVSMFRLLILSLWAFERFVSPSWHISWLFTWLISPLILAYLCWIVWDYLVCMASCVCHCIHLTLSQGSYQILRHPESMSSHCLTHLSGYESARSILWNSHRVLITL